MIRIATCCVLLILGAGLPAIAQVTVKLGAVSEYIWRGQPLSEGDPAPQLTLRYDSPKNVYLGLFVSDIEEPADLETNLFLGWKRKPKDRFGLDVGIRYYSYLSETAENFISLNQNNEEFFEAHLELSYRIAYLRYHREFKSDSNYLKGGVSAPLPYDLTLEAHYGLIRPINSFSDYEEYKVGLIKTWRGFDFEIAYAGFEAPWEDGDLVVGVAKTWTFMD